MKVSVAIITYNQKAFIGQAIESALMQETDFDFEIVVGDDCSTDGTRETLLALVAKHPGKIRPILPDHNTGIHRNLDLTLQACQGEYVALLEGDDFWTAPAKLQQQSDFLDAHPELALCFTNSSIVDAQGTVTKAERLGADRKRVLTQHDIISGLIPPTNTVMFRRDFVRTIPDICFDIINGDWLIFSLITRHGNAGYMDTNTGAYRMHGGGAWSNKTEFHQCLQYVKSCRAMLALFKNGHEAILQSKLETALNRLVDLEEKSAPETLDFTDEGLWTPQTCMLNTINDKIQGLADNPCRALSIDRNPTIDKILLNRWPKLSIQYAQYPEFDAEHLDQLQSDQFDIVYSHQVLEHIPKPWIAAREFVRVLKRGGVGIHTSCAFNPRHGQPLFNDYYRFLPDGLEQLFDGIETLHKGEWGNRQAVLYNVAIDDGHGALGGRRFGKKIGEESDGLYPWHTWLIFRKS